MADKPTAVKHMTRRQFVQVVAMYGMTAALGARSLVAEAKEPPTFARIQDKAKQLMLAQAKSARKREVLIRMGVSGDSSEVQVRGFPVGYWEFARDLEQRTHGRIQVQLLGQNSLCTELTCAQKFSAGTIPAFGSSSQNASLTYPFLTALDFPFLFPSRASMHYFLYSRKGDQIFRKILREKFEYEFLWSLAEGRAIFMGKGWRDKPPARLPDQIRGAKIRVTGSPMGRIALDLYGANPIPLDWAETYEGLKSGVVDGMENFPSAAPAYRMTPALSQCINAEFFAGFEHAAISRKFLEKLPNDLREAVMESAFHCQQWTQSELEKAVVELNGLTDPPKPGTTFHKDGIRVIILTPAEKREWERVSPENNPKPYAEWRERVAKMAGGIDVYSEIRKIAREIPENTPVEAVKPIRWWKS